MKKLLIILLFLPIFSYGQNWWASEAVLKYATDTTVTNKNPLNRVINTSDGLLRKKTLDSITRYFALIRYVDSLFGTAGTVVSFSQGWGLTFSPNPLVSSGSGMVDSAKVASRLRVQKAVDSLNVVSAGKVSTSDGTYAKTINLNLPFCDPSSSSSISNTVTITPIISDQSANNILGNHTGSTSPPQYSTLSHGDVVQHTSTSSFTTSVTINSTDERKVEFYITAQNGNLLFNNPTGTFVDGQILEIAITDNTTPSNLTFGVNFHGGTIGLPTITISGLAMYMTFVWRTGNKLDLRAVTRM